MCTVSGAVYSQDVAIWAENTILSVHPSPMYINTCMYTPAMYVVKSRKMHNVKISLSIHSLWRFELIISIYPWFLAIGTWYYINHTMHKICIIVCPQYIGMYNTYMYVASYDMYIPFESHPHGVSYRKHQGTCTTQ